MKIKKHTKANLFIASLLLLMVPYNYLYANGFNKISLIVIPALIIIFAIAYWIIALIPAGLIYFIIKIFTQGNRKLRFMAIYLGSWLGGEIGIGLSVLVWIYFIDPAVWSSYHYTLYPYLVSGGSILGGFLGYIISKRGGNERR